MIVTIGRQYGSGGLEIASKMAERLGYAYYDNMLLEEAATAGNIDQDIAKQLDEKPMKSMMFGAYMAAAGTFSEVVPLNQKLAFAQFDEIRRIADKGNAIIVGRCADYILRDRKDVAKVFLYANMDFRRKRAIEKYGIPEELVDKTIKKHDKARSDFYNFFTQQKWGYAFNYDLCVDVGFLGTEHTGELLANYMRIWTENNT